MNKSIELITWVVYPLLTFARSYFIVSEVNCRGRAMFWGFIASEFVTICELLRKCVVYMFNFNISHDSKRVTYYNTSYKYILSDYAFRLNKVVNWDYFDAHLVRWLYWLLGAFMWTQNNWTNDRVGLRGCQLFYL